MVETNAVTLESGVLLKDAVKLFSDDIGISSAMLGNWLQKDGPLPKAVAARNGDSGIYRINVEFVTALDKALVAMKAGGAYFKNQVTAAMKTPVMVDAVKRLIDSQWSVKYSELLKAIAPAPAAPAPKKTTRREEIVRDVIAGIYHSHLAYRETLVRRTEIVEREIKQLVSVLELLSNPELETLPAVKAGPTASVIMHGPTLITRPTQQTLPGTCAKQQA